MGFRLFLLAKIAFRETTRKMTSNMARDHCVDFNSDIFRLPRVFRLLPFLFSFLKSVTLSSIKTMANHKISIPQCPFISGSRSRW